MGAPALYIKPTHREINQNAALGHHDAESGSMEDESASHSAPTQVLGAPAFYIKPTHREINQNAALGRHDESGSMEDDHDALVSFMQVTTCSSLSDATELLASCGWRLDDAVDKYFASGAGSSEEAVRAPIPARSETLYGRSYSAARHPSPRPSGWESEVSERAVGRRREEGTSGDGTSEMDAAPPAKKKTLAGLFRPPHDLTYKGGFHAAIHAAKVHAAGLSRWLLVNVQASGEFASHVQNRDVWASDLVAQAVRDHFVLWQADTDERGDGGDEGSKVCCYYKLQRDKLPAVLVVDPVTGQLMDKLHGATDPNDFLMTADKFTDRKPIMAVRKPASRSVAAQGKQEPAVPTATSTRSESAPSGQEQPPPAMKPVETVAAVVPPADERIPGEKVCKMRVRLPDGWVVTKEFGSQCGVARLFAFCRSFIAEGGAAEQPFRLMLFTGASREEISDENASFEELGLHLSTVSVVTGVGF